MGLNYSESLPFNSYSYGLPNLWGIFLWFWQRGRCKILPTNHAALHCHQISMISMICPTEKHVSTGLNVWNCPEVSDGRLEIVATPVPVTQVGLILQRRGGGVVSTSICTSTFQGVPIKSNPKGWWIHTLWERFGTRWKVQACLYILNVWLGVFLGLQICPKEISWYKSIE